MRFLTYSMLLSRFSFLLITQFCHIVMMLFASLCVCSSLLLLVCLIWHPSLVCSEWSDLVSFTWYNVFFRVFRWCILVIILPLRVLVILYNVLRSILLSASYASSASISPYAFLSSFAICFTLRFAWSRWVYFWMICFFSVLLCQVFPGPILLS